MSLFSKTSKNFVVLLWSGSEQRRNADSNFAFRATSDFLYLTGFSEPETMMLLVSSAGKQKSLIGVRPRDLSHNRGSEIWEGERVGVERAPKLLGFDEAFDVHDTQKLVSEHLKQAQNVYWSFGEFAEWDKHLLEIARKILDSSRGPDHIKNWIEPRPYLADMRSRKSSEEIRIMRQSAKIASKAHIEAMKTVRVGGYEYQVQAETERVFLMEGASASSYTSIVAAGNNACTLHYRENRKRLEKDDLVLMDAGAEYEGYASDITRCFPASGKFTEAQAEIYSWVLKANKAAIKAVRPGASFKKPHETALRVVCEGLSKMKIIKKPASRIYSEKLFAPFMPHGTSHFLGLDVHDPGDTVDSKAKPTKLQVGNVITIEPGLYFRSDDRRVPKKYRGIGVRIEDDVAVTKSGSEVLSRDCPKEIKEIEQIAARER